MDFFLSVTVVSRESSDSRLPEFVISAITFHCFVLFVFFSITAC